MSRLPIRGRLTAAFAAAMFVVLAVTGLFVYLRLQADLVRRAAELLGPGVVEGVVVRVRRAPR